MTDGGTDGRTGAARGARAGTAAAALAACLAAAACGGTAEGRTVTQGTTHRVGKGALRIVLKETGTLKAKNSVAIKAEIPGTAKVVWLVPEGTEVKQGDRLAELDKTELQRNVDNLASNLVSLESERKTAKTEFEIQDAEGRASVDKARLALEIKKKEAERYRLADAPQTLRKKELAVEKAESEFNRKEQRFRETQGLLAEGFVTPTQVEEERIALRSAEIERDSARDDLKGYADFTADIERRQKESDLAEAQRSLDNEILRAENLLDRKKVNYEQTEQRYKSTREQYEEQVKQLEAMTVLAPAQGIVIYQAPNWNEEELKVGSTIYNEQAFLQLPDLSEMEVKVGIHEADINRLKLGQSVFVTVDSHKGKQLEGEISKIATIAGERDWRSDVRKFEVVVALKKSELALKPGLTAKVEILVGEVGDVLTVPLQSVFVKEGKYYAFVDKGGRPERREVELGESNDNFVVVKSGIAEGDEVLLWNPEATDAAAPARQNGAAKGDGDKSGSPAARGGKP